MNEGVLSIINEMRCFDEKDRTFWNSLTDEERKKCSLYLMIRWGSCVQGSSDLQEYYLLSCNVKLNKNFFAVNKHPELQWLMCTAVSPGLGSFRHNWIAPKKREGKNNNKVEKFIAKLYPSMKMSDVQLMSEFTDIKELKVLAKDMGFTPEQIKKELS
jgi:hypothetical protein